MNNYMRAMAALGAWALERVTGDDVGDIDAGELHDEVTRLGLWTKVPILHLGDLCRTDEDGGRFCDYCEVGSLCWRLGPELQKAMENAQAYIPQTAAEPNSSEPEPS